ncbi:MAG: polyprenyl synthetase family protein [Clostridia bacterium]|nr:polyprenyl synthetase family protein [Clostridia bacterium]
MFKDSDKYLSLVDKTLIELINSNREEYKALNDAMEYSVSAGGKRIRPMLSMAFCTLCGESPEKALYPACGVELIHTYSLIHDDLPCMDNDDMRRGKPSNHIVFGEDTALLAGDSLQSLAFESITCEKSIELIGFEAAAKCVLALARLCGKDGMVGGQVVDLALEKTIGDIETVTLMHSLKTAALIKAACVMGCIVAGADDKKITAASEYAECIGLQFQIVDDILDVTSTTDVLGKPVNSDIENNKSNMVSLLGVDKCQALAKELTDKAINALDAFSGDTQPLADFALKLLNRNK